MPSAREEHAHALGDEPIVLDDQDSGHGPQWTCHERSQALTSILHGCTAHDRGWICKPREKPPHRIVMLAGQLIRPEDRGRPGEGTAVPGRPKARYGAGCYGF